MYGANDLAVVVTGTLNSAESWSNSWAFTSTVTPDDAQDVVDILHAFYAHLADDLPVLSDEWLAVDARAVALAGPVEVPVTWTTIDGEQGENMLPTECALRLSATGVDGARGGPFLAGFTTACVDADGTLLASYKAEVVACVQALADDLVASDYTLALRRPGPAVLEEVLTVRVGEVFDVIRKRRNDLPENYSSVVFA